MVRFNRDKDDIGTMEEDADKPNIEDVVWKKIKRFVRVTYPTYTSTSMVPHPAGVPPE